MNLQQVWLMVISHMLLKSTPPQAKGPALCEAQTGKAEQQMSPHTNRRSGPSLGKL